MALQIAQDATQRDYGLTDQLWTIVEGRLVPYEYDWMSSADRN
jgi:hypothetical protein